MENNQNNEKDFLASLSQELEILKKEDILPLKPSSIREGLSEDQNKALNFINEWLARVYRNRDEQNFFALRGSAGTGKTTLISSLLKEIKSPYSKGRICICAPTHKAKKVIVSKTGWRISETLQALLGLKLDTNLDDFDINNPQFNQIGERKIRDYDLVIIDESSMVNSQLYTTVNEAARQCGCKILFVGDTLQLNPVKEYGISPSLITPVNSYTLTQIVRQGKTNPLILVLDALRFDLENNTNTFMKILKDNPEKFNELGEGYKVCDRTDFGKLITSNLQGNEFAEDKNYCRYISWTNQSITETNNWIRNNVIPSLNGTGPIDSTIQLDEVLLSYKTVTEGDKNIEVILTNSDDYKVDNIEDAIVSKYEYPLKTKFVTLSSIDTNNTSEVHLLVRDKENYQNYVAILNMELAKAKKTGGRKGWSKFYEFKNLILVLENLYNENKTLLVKKDIDYGYGITIHKSQGSTFNTVFVNGKDINKNLTDIERKRLWYVALSRASCKAYIIL